MIEIVVSSETLKVVIPKENSLEAPLQLGNIWRDEFAGRLNFVVEITEPIKEFLEKIKLGRSNILVYR